MSHPDERAKNAEGIDPKRPEVIQSKLDMNDPDEQERDRRARQAEQDRRKRLADAEAERKAGRLPEAWSYSFNEAGCCYVKDIMLSPGQDLVVHVLKDGVPTTITLKAVVGDVQIYESRTVSVPAPKVY